MNCIYDVMGNCIVSEQAATSLFTWAGWILVGLIALIFISREFWCWYFKLTKIKTLLEKIEANTKKDTTDKGSVSN